MLRRAVAALICGLGLTHAAQAQETRLIEDALAAAAQTFGQVSGALGDTSMGVPTSEYRNALTRLRFASSVWGETLAVQISVAENGRGLCAGFAAYVTPAITQGAVVLTICPQFFSAGADALRETTILHEMVHVVAGTDECRAMAYTAQVQSLASGSYVPVRDYWAKNGCEGSRYKLPH